MNSVFFVRLFRLAIMLVLQVLVLNNVHLFGYVTPLLIGYMLVCLHSGTSRVSALLWGFLTGLVFDVFCNTAGMASSACTLVAMMQGPFLSMFVPRDAPEKFVPTHRSLGFWSYLAYVFVLMLVLHAVFYALDAFSLANWQLTLTAIIGGTILSTILAFFADLLVRGGKTHAQ